MRTRHYRSGLLAGMLLSGAVAHAADVTARLSLAPKGKNERMPPAVAWLTPLSPDAVPVHPGKFTLLQKNKMFSPHLLVVPLGSAVSFPNADPFFHNVFSLFDGKRFDLGLYEAGSMRTVTFSREGVSYIFCNIHPDMSAVVLSLATPYFSVAADDGVFRMTAVPGGTYELHVWVEGRRDDALNHLTRQVTVPAEEATDLGRIDAGPPSQPATHLNKFGQSYEIDHKTY
ncbi:hypothetical protein [Terriglobus roseus]|uniref:Plastocyanin n=1 Tax=Terriglobus roseus TaxID=392734 RepID=A0A1H4NUR6_9BACT|nr:hypothetical protein [Terriglobus roseus]SEB98879.1 hypothetical protein SAMN05443244_2360 [Terriglobus roseus]